MKIDTQWLHLYLIDFAVEPNLFSRQKAKKSLQMCLIIWNESNKNVKVSSSRVKRNGPNFVSVWWQNCQEKKSFGTGHHHHTVVPSSSTLCKKIEFHIFIAAGETRNRAAATTAAIRWLLHTSSLSAMSSLAQPRQLLLTFHCVLIKGTVALLFYSLPESLQSRSFVMLGRSSGFIMFRIKWLLPPRRGHSFVRICPQAAGLMIRTTVARPWPPNMCNEGQKYTLGSSAGHRMHKQHYFIYFSFLASRNVGPPCSK